MDKMHNRNNLDDEYFHQLRQSWHNSQVKLSDKEILAIFPEAKEIIPEKIKEWERVYGQLIDMIKQKLIIIRQATNDEFSIWFWRHWVKVNKGEELVTARKHIKRLNWLIQDQTRPNKNSINRDDIEKAKEVPLVELVGVDVRLRRAGKTYSGLCPFHQEKHPSFYVYTDSNTFVCFGCQKKGDAITYAMETRKLTFIEAVRWLLKG